MAALVQLLLWRCWLLVVLMLCLLGMVLQGCGLQGPRNC
jgi:hypothetical protein